MTETSEKDELSARLNTLEATSSKTLEEFSVARAALDRVERFVRYIFD